MPFELTLTRLVVRFVLSRTKTSLTPLLSPLTRFVAADQKATKRPFAISGNELYGELLRTPNNLNRQVAKDAK